ncbi:MAG TPA: nucleotidyltransferase family protein [Candidatus Udaeobacter sp.]|nr:nucleotidyltransferase family protein [Candidatus Udaeobacter sp.]
MTASQGRIEHEVLLLCARSELAPEQIDRLRVLVESNLDWDYFYQLARRHSLVALVAFQLERSVKESVPPEVRQSFRKDYQENAARNLVLADELISLVKACTGVGVEVVIFKGPSLAVSAYGDLALRRFIDLDLIVRRADVGRAVEVLTAQGYKPSRPLNAEQQALLVRTQHNLQFTRGRLIVELHWQVSSELFAASVTAEELWQDLETIRINQADMKTLATENLLFSLCVHGSRHLWQRLAWICDLDRIIATRKSIDWSRLMTRAKQTSMQRMFLLGPALAAKILATRLPDSIRDAIGRDRRIDFLAGRIQERLFDGPEQLPASLGAILRYNLLIRKDWRSRLRYCRFLFAPTDSDLGALRLSPSFHFVYYLLRPFRLLHSARARASESPNVGGTRN